MTYQTCEDCGTKMNRGFCPNCNEEVFIAEQYRELGESVPDQIAEKEFEHLNNPSKPYEPRYK